MNTTNTVVGEHGELAPVYRRAYREALRLNLRDTVGFAYRVSDLIQDTDTSYAEAFNAVLCAWPKD